MGSSIYDDGLGRKDKLHGRGGAVVVLGGAPVAGVLLKRGGKWDRSGCEGGFWWKGREGDRWMRRADWRYVSIDDGLRYLQHFLLPCHHM
ncbi:hypothetical protein QQP08_016443 [Theobroma cacao]|nr:hypothetical protein QQP08_016443 [Theobroma cacao]